MSDDPFKALEDKLSAAFQVPWDAALAALRTAFEAGKSVGKAEAAADISRRLEGLLPASTATLPPLPPLPASPAAQQPEKRAQRGTVRPTIVAALEGGHGLTAAQITAMTGLNENTVRGTLNSLLAEKVAVKRQRKWHLAVNG